ncbi:MAG: SLC13 family permease [Myxococcales bacterium]|nr:SLC13 family permease [Myxococcales bacterium]
MYHTIIAAFAEAEWLFTLGVVAVATWAMARERLGPDVVMFLALCVLVVFGVVEPEAALSGFSEPAVATIAVLLVVAGAVSETGALKLFSNSLLGRSANPVVVLLRMMIPTAVLSAFLNNTPIVAMFIPMVRSHARQIGLNPSKLLLPLAWAAMFGGTCTMVGTSANLVVGGMLAKAGAVELSVLEIGLVGVPTTLVGITYLALVGVKLVPDRTDPVAAAIAEARDYLVELRVAPDSPLVRSTVQDAGLRSLPGLFLAEIRRENGEVVNPVRPVDRLHASDLLVFTGITATVRDLISQFPGLKPVDEAIQLDKHELFEVVVSHRSPLVGLTVRDADFRRRFDAAIMAVHRSGERIQQKIGDIVLAAGDSLMLWASPGFRNAWQGTDSFYLVSELRTEALTRYPRARFVLAVAAAMVVVPALTGIPLLVSAMAALALLFVTNCIGVRAARASLNWTVLVLIGSAFGVAHALNESGAAEVMAQGILSLTQPLGPRATLAAVYVLGVTVASFVSNAAGAALVFPVALQAAALGAHDPRPFAIAIAMAASAGFSTPIGCPPNLLVYGPGGYRYMDFVRVGLPLNVLFLVVAVVLIPLWWPF